MVENTETQKHLKTVVKGAGLIFVGLMFSKILTYFYRLIIARYYGPEDYGLISIGLSVIGVLVIILLLGMDSGIVRYVSEYRAKNDVKRLKGIIVNPLRITLPLSIVVAVLIWFFSPSLAAVFAKDAATQAGLTMIFQILSFTLPFSVFYNFFLSACKGFQNMKYSVYTDNIFFSIVLVSSIVVFSLLGFGLAGIAWSYALTVIASFLYILYYFNRRMFNIFGKTKALFENKDLMRYSIPLFIGSLANIAIGSFDTIFLGVFKTATDVGIYNAALPTAKFILVFSIAFGTLFAPIVIEYKTKKLNQEILSLYRTTTKWIFLSGFPFALLLMFFSRNVLNILFGAEYASVEAFSSLSILGMAFFIQSFLMTSTLMLLSIDKTKYTMVDIILAALINLALNMAFIPQYGMLGAAVATSISAIFVVLMDSVFAWRFTKMNPLDFKGILKSVFAGMLSLIFIIVIYRFIGLSASLLTLLPLFFVFLFVYIMQLLVYKALDKNDVFILAVLEKKLGVKVKFIRKFVRRFIT